FSLASRERFPGAVMYMRKGYDATAMRSRGGVGKSTCGLPWGEAAKSDPGIEPAIMLPAARVESVSRNERRVYEFIFVDSPEVRTGFYDARGPAQSSFKNTIAGQDFCSIRGCSHGRKARDGMPP